MNFNERLKSIRKHAKITQKSVADYLGVTLRTYQRYEEGTIEPPLATINAISEYFDMPLDCLLANGFFFNWEEILLHRDTLLEFLDKHVFSLPDDFDIFTFTDSQLARLLPALFAKIIFIDESTIEVFPLLPLDMFPVSIRADGF